MKEINRKKGDSHPPRRREHRTVPKKGGAYGYRTRRRRILGIALIALLLLGVVVLVDYLLDDGELLRWNDAGEVVPGEGQSAVSEGENRGGAAVENEAASEPAPSVLLGEFFTDYAWDPDEGRQSNLKTAAGAIDNTVLAPGEEFSALEVLSPLEYQPAKVFANGGVDYEVGGGLCQVSSTLFMAANYAGLEIVERNPHYAELPYIRPGLDATVWFGEVENAWGALDMRFKNNTDGDILIRQFVNEDGFMVAEIYGEEPSDKRVSMTSEKVDEDLGKGIKWATYKQVEEDGELVEDGLLFETTYSYNPPVPEEFKHETNEPRGSGWVDVSNTTNWNNKDQPSD
ncbi:MAG: VanW family protein [Actinobacteria bacterium]|nr:VanW family protein [Actinomycetota bacterium]